MAGLSSTTMMAYKFVLIKEFCVSGNSKLVPVSKVRSYKELERLSYGAFRKDKACEAVHFHLDEKSCKGEIDEFMWDEGVYLDDGEIRVYAHFVEKSVNDNKAPFTQDIVQSSSLATHHREAVVISLTESEPTQVLFTPRPSTSTNSSALKRPSSSSSTTKLSHKRAKLDHLPLGEDDDDYINDESRLTMSNDLNSQIDKEHSANGGKLKRVYCRKMPLYRPSIGHPPLHKEATLSNWEFDFYHFLTKGAPEGYPTYRDDWFKLSHSTKREFAHAACIETVYGMTLPNRCSACVEKGPDAQCRVYHPAIFDDKSFVDSNRGTLSLRCSRCLPGAKYACDALMVDGESNGCEN
ncbi:hypothetical protein B0J11DRAFT_603432 [Dendryphion nanum]|uniref:Uncharacterized protein n=1 Tax=Dendryphion nanum TaxID=256645 RepID=A0A9P9IR70_9PLEO|nr:hypothetical protein B0J11DRAFT_603432 [Dendryphion nanum]